MTPSDRDKSSMVDNLLRQGISKQEIEKVHRDLRDRGYGEEEARRRSQLALERMKVQREQEERRREKRNTRVVERPTERPDVHRPARAGASGRRAVDSLPVVPSALRRRINRWAFRAGLLITRLPERLEDFASIFDGSRPDYVNKALLRMLAARRARRDAHPFEYSLIESLETLGSAARRLLGGPASHATSLDREMTRPREEAVKKSLAVREPFALEFFGRFAEPQDMLEKSLEYLSAALRAGLRVEVSGLARVVKDGLRLIYATQPIGIDTLDALFDAAREANLAHGDSRAEELAEAEAGFRASFQNLPRYSRELYPALLKCIASFYDEMDDGVEKRARVLAFLELREDEILSYEDWQRRAREGREKALRERQEQELARLEQEKAERFSLRFEGTLATLAQLFPESGIERVEQGEFVLPYFVNRVFTRSPIFQGRITDLESLSASDPMGLIMVLHMVLDDLLSSVEPWPLEKSLGKEGLAETLIELREAWQRANARLFDAYIDEIRQYARESDGDPRYARIFRESAKARGMEERVNQLRNAAIRNFGHVLADRERTDAPRLHELAARLAALAGEAGEIASRAEPKAEDPVRRKLAEDLGSITIVDFAARSHTGSTDYRPVTRQIKRWVEARHREAVSAIPRLAQVAFLDILWGIAELYSYLLNDPKSFAARAGHGITVAGDEEHATWARERGMRGRESLDLLEAKLKEEFPGQFVDGLTGLKNKDFFLAELPRQLERLKARRRPFTFLLADIDHFKWVNDELGHSRGDEVLKTTAAGILDGIREGDLAVRYGGEEILVVVPADLHTGVILAERLRDAQEQILALREALASVQEIGRAHGQPCGTLSIGVAEVSGAADLAGAVELADKALYAAKRTRNAVVLIDPEKSKRTGEPFTTYAEYLKRRQGE
jgi:diguanylate cyclase (GGDEF)-like protein